MTYSFYRIVLAIIAAALVAFVFTIISATADQGGVRAATSEFEGDVGALAAKCALQAWPFYEPDCIRDLRPSSAGTRLPRIVRIDRAAMAFASADDRR